LIWPENNDGFPGGVILAKEATRGLLSKKGTAEISEMKVCQKNGTVQISAIYHRKLREKRRICHFRFTSHLIATSIPHLVF